jgi:hypothetical protein
LKLQAKIVGLILGLLGTVCLAATNVTLVVERETRITPQLVHFANTNNTYAGIFLGLSDAYQVAYNATTVGDTLDTLLYVAPTVSLSGGTVYDNGRTITNVSLTWTANKTMTTRVLSNGHSADLGAGGSGSYTVTNALDATQTSYTLTVGDGTGTAVSSTVNYFRNRLRYGFSSTGSSIDDSGIIALSGSAFLTTSYILSTTSLTPTGSQYIWVCYPASLGVARFRINGFPVTGWTLETANYTNPYGAVVSYSRYRSPQAYNVPVDLEVY